MYVKYKNKQDGHIVYAAVVKADISGKDITFLTDDAKIIVPDVSVDDAELWFKALFEAPQSGCIDLTNLNIFVWSRVK